MPTRRPTRRHLATMPVRTARGLPAALGLGSGLLGVLSILSFAGCAAPKRVLTRPPAAAPVPSRQTPPPDVQDEPALDAPDLPSLPDSQIASSPGSQLTPWPTPPALAPSPRPRAGLAPPPDVAGAAELREVDEDLGATLAAVSLAQQLIGKPYRYGGRTPSGGFDCSGLVQYVFGQQGLELPRTARRQARAGQHVEREELEPGDLVFFRIGGERINHVGIYAGDDEFIHAPRSGRAVCRESLHNPWWRRRYAGARRVH
jgi:murein DD-endopeptidase